MFNSIRAKLLMMILIANTLVVLAIFVANQLAFEKSFSQYVADTTRLSLTPVIEAMVTEIKRQPHFDWLRPNNAAFQDIVAIYRLRDDAFAAPKSAPTPRLQRPPPREEGLRPPPHMQGDRQRPRLSGQPPSNRPNLGEDAQRLMFKSASGELILGAPSMAKAALWLALKSGDDAPSTAGTGELLGYLGIENGSRMNAKFDALFAQQQSRQFSYIAVIVLVLSFVMALPFSRFLVKPILILRAKARDLANGHYDFQLTAKNSDEIGELVKDINRLAQTLNANRRSQRQWIADISHELRTPIAVIRAELEGMMDGIIALDAAAIASLHEEMARLTRLVDDLHQLSLADKGALTYTFKSVNLLTLLNKVLAKHQGGLTKQGFAVTPLTGAGSNIQGDPERLMQLFDNLMQNTLRYTDSTPASPGQLAISVHESSQSITVLWQDSAPTVAAEKLPQLFERLYRIEDDRNRATGGSGLGLAICRSIVCAHQGRIQAEPSDLGGVTIKVEFAKE
ncbi:two-component system, OmpR family, sensor histidine kinase BaeS [Pseudoalteromonas ulvae UL12]|uniref:ATP-binding protein n=1 Tax=Pseudoalteromonas ulvae TaxID=107327 RepID=UPI00186B6A38|nr:ATP-binding protein [Pseudoalteromonas ulvae]MBE0365543.1 two-component system, OmpR family, sensor histidine kinase BaeS [Pseudoalteromonas ulvae UL12]